MATPTTARSSSLFSAMLSFGRSQLRLPAFPLNSRISLSRCGTSHARFGNFCAKALAGVLCLLLCACGGGNSSSVQEVGVLRIVHAVSDAPDITFFLEGSGLGSLSFGQASPFSAVADGNFDVDAVFNTADQQTITLLDDERVRVRFEEQTTFVLAGTVAAPIAFAIEANDPEIATDTAEVQLLNTAGANALDFYLTDAGAPLGTAQASVAANAASEVLTFSAGQKQVRLTGAGSSDVIFDSGSFTMPSGQRLIMHARPYFGPGAATVDLTVIDGGSTANFPEANLPASVRIANAIADLPAADVTIESGGQSTQLTSLPSNSFSDPIDLVPGTVDISVTMQTDPGTVFVNTNAIVAGGEQRTLIAAGNFGTDTTAGRLALDPQRPISSAAQINFMHGSASAGQVDAYLLIGDATLDATAPVVPDLQLLANTNMNIIAGTYSLVFTRRGENTALAGPITVSVDNNILYSVLLTDAQGGGEPPQIILGANFE